MNRREFIIGAVAAAGAARLGIAQGGTKPAFKSITIAKTACDFEREPMVRPFGFKGGYLTEEWIVSAYVRSTSGKHGIGLGTQNCLWSDAGVFATHAEAGGNAIMFAMTQYALKLIEGKTFTSPVELNDWLWPQVWEYGKAVAANSKLRATYALNALVAVDNALWVLFSRENNLSSFDEMIPDAYHPALSARHTKCASIPLFSYNVPATEIRAAAEAGSFFMKIKIGQPGTQEEMLAKDCARVSEIHALLKDCRTPYTKSGKLPYYFDANGRYEKKETFLRFVDHLEKIGALEQVAIVEEPFDEFAEAIKVLNDKGVDYLISYDGICGGKEYGEDLPASLGCKKIMLDAGLSSQALLLGKKSTTFEALYISESLIPLFYAVPKQLSLMGAMA